MPLAPDPPFPKSRNDTVRSKDWNDAVQEVIRLDGAKLDRGGDTLSGSLTITGALGVGGATAPASGLQMKSLTAVNEGTTGSGAWANFGSNAYFDGSWNRIDATKPGANLHINGDGGGVEFRFLRIEADGTNARNIAQIGTAGTAINEGTLSVVGPTPANTWKFLTRTNMSGSDQALGLLVQSSADSAFAIGGEFTSTAGNNNSCYGVLGLASASGTGTAVGVYGGAGGNAATLWAGYFGGNVHVAGTLSKGSGSFVIDHVLDPEHKILRHNLVESPEHLCVYRGTAALDDGGRVTVELPDYFAALTDEENATVHLTPIGEEPFPAGYRWNDEHTAFTVVGSPHAEVSYMVLAARDDPVIHQLGRPVEEEKGGEFPAGQMLYPEAFGRPVEQGVGFAMERSLMAQPMGDPPGEAT